MGMIHRFTTTISSSFDWVINQIENHEALVNSAIRDATISCAKAQAQHERVKKDGAKMRAKLAELQQAILTWEERAKRSSEQDKERALECLRRKKRFTAELTALEIEERKHSTMEKQLGEDIQQLAERIRKLKEQRNLMKTRESRAEAVKLLGAHDSQAFTEIDSLFERWESKVGVYEMGLGNTASVDALEESFLSNEEREELLIELARLSRIEPADH